MREILFRGKIINQDKWIYGYLFSDGRTTHILIPQDDDETASYYKTVAYGGENVYLASEISRQKRL